MREALTSKGSYKAEPADVRNTNMRGDLVTYTVKNIPETRMVVPI